MSFATLSAWRRTLDNFQVWMPTILVERFWGWSIDALSSRGTVPKQFEDSEMEPLGTRTTRFSCLIRPDARFLASRTQSLWCLRFCCYFCLGYFTPVSPIEPA